jgi:hypothetical protein
MRPLRIAPSNVDGQPGAVCVGAKPYAAIVAELGLTAA